MEITSMNGLVCNPVAQSLPPNLGHQNRANLRQKSFDDLKKELLDGLNKKRDSINNQIKECTDIDKSKRINHIRKVVFFANIQFKTRRF